MRTVRFGPFFFVVWSGGWGGEVQPWRGTVLGDTALGVGRHYLPVDVQTRVKTLPPLLMIHLLPPAFAFAGGNKGITRTTDCSSGYGNWVKGCQQT